MRNDDYSAVSTTITHNLTHDVRHALRNAIKQPALSLLIVLTLAMGIGVNTAMFSAAWQVLLAPLPYADSDRLILIKQDIPGKGRVDSFWSLPTFRDVQAQSALLFGVAGYEQQSLPVLKDGEPISALAGVVSANYFDVLGVAPMLGRTFTSSDEVLGSPPVMLVSQSFWAEAFNSDPSVVGTSIDVYGLQVTIIGVLPKLPPYPKDNDIWVTHAGDAYTMRSSFNADDRNGYWFEHVLARMKPGVALSSVNEELNTTASRLEQGHPDIYLDNYSLQAEPLQQEMSGESRPTFLLLQTMALLVLLIASANVGNLTLAKLASRHQELAIHEALGASPSRLRMQLLAEALLLAGTGGGIGLLFAWWSIGLLRDFTAQHTPMASEIGIDGAVLAFAVFITLLAGLLSGLAPTFMRRDINGALKEGGDKVTSSAGVMRKRQSLLVLQYALAFVMLTSAGLVSLSLYSLASQDAGYDTEGVLAISMLFRVDMTQDSQQFKSEIERFSRDLMSRVEMLPQVITAGFYGGTPLLDDPLYELSAESLEIEGGSAQLRDPYAFAKIRLASGSFFDVMNISLLEGRAFDNSDNENSPKAAIVNSSFSERYFAGAGAVGRRIRIAPYDTEWSTIVGVVSDVRGTSLHNEEGEVFYLNYEQHFGDILNLYVKANGNLADLGFLITNIIHELAPSQPVDSARPLIEIRKNSLAPAGVRTLLISLFGLLGLGVTLTGVVGVVSNHIREQRHETAIRIAVGATPQHILWMFLKAGLRTYALGLGTGLVLMLLLAPLLQPLLYETNTFEPEIYLTSAGLLTLAVVLTMYQPAHEASRLRPSAALKAE